MTKGFWVFCISCGEEYEQKIQHLCLLLAQPQKVKKQMGPLQAFPFLFALQEMY